MGLPLGRSVFDCDVSKVRIPVLGESGHINVSAGIKSRLDGLIGAVSNAVVVTSNPCLLNLRLAFAVKKNGCREN